MRSTERAVAVRTADGTTEPLGSFLDLLARRTGRSITTLARDAGISRAYYYVVRDGSQTPSIETLANLFTAMEVDFRLAEADEAAAFAVRSDGEEWQIHLPYDPKREARARAVREMSINLSRSTYDEPPSGVADEIVEARPPAAAAPARAAQTFVVGRSTGQRPQSVQQGQVLSELLSVASLLDPERLEHLLATARLLADRH